MAVKTVFILKLTTFAAGFYFSTIQRLRIRSNFPCLKTNILGPWLQINSVICTGRYFFNFLPKP